MSFENIQPVARKREIGWIKKRKLAWNAQTYFVLSPEQSTSNLCPLIITVMKCRSISLIQCLCNLGGHVGSDTRWQCWRLSYVSVVYRET